MTFNVSPLDPYASAIQVWLNEGRTNSEIVSLLSTEFEIETSESSIRRAIDRFDLIKPSRFLPSDVEKARVEFSGDTALFVTEPLEKLGDIESLLASRGLDPEEWNIERVVVNEWESLAKDITTKGNRVQPLRQLKIWLRKKMPLDILFPAIDIAPIQPPERREINDWDQPFLVVICGDEQEPHSDPILRELFLEWLAENTPMFGIHLGDLMDFSSISRHRDNPVWDTSPQECIQAGFETLKSRREISPKTFWTYMPGNHEQRLRDYQLQRAERLYGVRPADIGKDEDDLLSVRRLLHLDQLGIDYVEPDGDYTHAQVRLSDRIAVRHGWLIGANSPGQTLDRLKHSLIVGHTHRQRLHSKTRFDIEGKPTTLVAVEVGTMTKLTGGLGYTVDPDWQNGFATASIFPDGSFTIDLATYSDGSLRWRDKQYAQV